MLERDKDHYSMFKAWNDPSNFRNTVGPETNILTIRDKDGKIIEQDPNGVPANTPGAKLDAGKTRVWLMFAGFANALSEVAKVTTVGAEKYTPNGWATVPDGVDRYMQAFGRHMVDLGSGEIFDNGPGGTGCRHKAQMIWNLLASLELELRESKK